MHNCPHCHLEVQQFSFYCPRCSKLIGMVDIDHVMLATWWLDDAGQPSKKCGVKTLKRNQQYLDLADVSPKFPTAQISNVTFILADAAKTQLTQDLSEFFEQATSSAQEWEV
jgi:hypothetical protein